MKIIASVILLTSVATVAFVVNPEVPEAVLKSFNTMYADADDVEWDQDDNLWEAEFELGDAEMEAAFKADGSWVETEMEISIDAVPALVSASLAKYPGYTITEAIEYKSAEIAKAYELKIKKGSDKVEMLIDPSGRILKMDDEDDDEDDDDDGQN